MIIEKPVLNELVRLANAGVSSTVVNLTSLMKLICDGDNFKIQTSNNSLFVESFAELSDKSAPFECYILAREFARAVALFNRTVKIEPSEDGKLLTLSEGNFSRRLCLMDVAAGAWTFYADPAETETKKLTQSEKHRLFSTLSKMPTDAPVQPRGVVNFRSAYGVLETTATDGKKLTQRKIPFENGGGFNVSFLPEIAALVEAQSSPMEFATIASNGAEVNKIYFKFDKVKYFAPLQIVNYDTVYGLVDKQRQFKDVAFKVKAGELRDSLAKFRDFNRVKFKWGGSCELKLYAASETGNAADTVELEESLKGGEVEFDPALLLTTIANADDDEEMTVRHQLYMFLFEYGCTFDIVMGLKQ